MDPVFIGVATIVGLLITIPVVVIIARSHKCKYDKVQDDGYQYCSICNAARKPIIPPCSHPKWEKLNTREIVTGSKSGYGRTATIGEVYVLRCEECGDMKEFRIDI